MTFWKRLTPIICLLFFLSSLPAQENIVVKCQLENCPNPPALYAFDGLSFQHVFDPLVDEEGKLFFEIPASTPKYYYLGTSNDQKKPILLGSESGVSIVGNCAAIQASAVANSPINKKYDLLKKTINGFDSKLGELTNLHRQFSADSDKQKELEEQLRQLDIQRITLLDSMKRINPFLGHIAALHTYLSFQNNGQQYNNEVEYFVNTYFRFADLKDPALNDIVYVYEAFRNYTNTISAIGLNADDHERLVKANLDQIPPNSQCYRYALGGVISSLRQKKHQNFPLFSQLYIDLFASVNPAATQDLQQQVDRMKASLPGALAPDFEQETPEGDTIKLSDFRGKITLVDFWASWCGPCRRENPNVVKLYQKYKDKGFAILGVSLDREKSRWVQAIEKDGLNWSHVSDLKGWKNQIAGLYGVTSIPHTVLLDREGRIIQRNLRGEQLAYKLEEIFGE